MGWIIDMSERDGDIRRFEEGLKAAKHGIMEVCEIWENMKSQFSERGGSYSERYGKGSYDQRNYGHMMSERDWEELQERRRRDPMGRFM
jgi:hypothetical protein